MSFSAKFNAWLIEQGGEPISDELAVILDEAARATADALMRPETLDTFQRAVAQLVSDYEAGLDVNPRLRAKETWDLIDAGATEDEAHSDDR